MKKLFVGLAVPLFVSFAHAESISTSPATRAAHVLSSSGPLTRQQLRQANTARPMASSGTQTYTYLRCYYRTGSPTQPTATYVWATDPSSGGYYQLNGFWETGSEGAWQNMFFTDVAQGTLQSICQDTLTQQGIQQPVALEFAADNEMSYNDTVWTNDSANQGSGINKIIAFGDSLSDNQNAYNLSEWLLPNSSSWFVGHFSNDQVWVEYLAQQLQLPLYDFAVGGAGASTRDLVIPGVIQQVASWQGYMQQAPNYNVANTLFTVLAGANDLDNGTSVASSMGNLTTALTDLVNAGARNILLLNLPDMSKSPSFQYRTDGATVSAEVTQFNSQLTALASRLRTQYGSSLNLQVFDTYSLFNDLLTHPALYQVTNTTQSCLDINSDSSTAWLSSQTVRGNCTNPNAFVFWDVLHPTTHTHQLLANAIYKFINQSGYSFNAPVLAKK